MSVLKSATAELYPTPAEKVEQKELCLESKSAGNTGENFSLHWAPILVQATILIPHCRDLLLTLCPPSSPSSHQQPEREKRSHLLFKVFRALLLGMKYKIYKVLCGLAASPIIICGQPQDPTL